MPRKDRRGGGWSPGLSVVMTLGQISQDKLFDKWGLCKQENSLSTWREELQVTAGGFIVWFVMCGGVVDNGARMENNAE